MGALVTYSLYLAISVSLTVGAGLVLSRSGQVFLRDVFGGDEALAKAVNRLLVVGFYLLMLGFVVLAMRPSGQITGVRQAAGLLSVKVGEVLLVLGALHLANFAIFRRIRRRPATTPPRPAQQEPAPRRGLPLEPVSRNPQDVH
jgi:uncharacterized membrane protein